ncbi:hypothetical protein CGCF413_v009164 [Colletotrichum fructicola]|nr:hypothetical protein CGCF413_v009164 [Colletotrichum fructicola]
MLPIVALGEQQKVAEAAIKAGVKRFIPNEYGSDSSLTSHEEHITWTAIITGPFFDWGLELGMTGFDLNNRVATLVDGGNTRFTTSTVAQIRRAIISVLKHPSETRNQLVFVESFTTTQLEILNALQEATGQDWKVKEETSENVRLDGFKKLGEGDIVGGGASVIMALVLGSEALEDHTSVKGGIWNERLGLEKESVEDTVMAVIKQAVADIMFLLLALNTTQTSRA